MNKYIKVFFVLLFFPFLLKAQVRLVNNGADLTINANTDVKVKGGSITNKNNGEIANAGNLYLGLDFTQNTGANYSGNATTGWLWFEGAVNQYIFSDNTLDIARLRVDNGNNVLIDNHVWTDLVNLSNNGKLVLGNYNLRYRGFNHTQNYDAANYIITNGMGHLQQDVGATATIYPVGNASYNPATIINTGLVDEIRIRVFDQVLHNGTTGATETSNVVGRTWMVSEGAVGGSNVNMNLQWDSPQELTAFDRMNCGVSHHLSGTLWDNPSSYSPATSLGGTTYTQSRGGFTSFSPFVVRDPIANLPIELLSFDAKRKTKSRVYLTWATASETNNKGFDVERMLANENTFSKIAWVDGNGTTLASSYYELDDTDGFSALAYYRLKQIDHDGTFTYSDVRAVAGWEHQNEGDLIVFPNPVDDYINIRLAAKSKSIKVKIVDVEGRSILNKTYEIGATNLLQIKDLDYLVSGTYLLTVVTDEGSVYNQKIIKK